VKFSNARFRANESSVPLVELTIRDLKDQALAHFPSGVFCANSAWTVIGALAHNLARWSTLPACPAGPFARRTLRRCPARGPRLADPQRPPLDSSPAAPLVLVGGLRGGADTDPGTAGRSSLSSLFTGSPHSPNRSVPWATRSRPTGGYEWPCPQLARAECPPAIRQSSPLTRSRAAIPLSLMGNRWIPS
jgi:hypothetical protein